MHLLEWPVLDFYEILEMFIMVWRYLNPIFTQIHEIA